MMEVQFYPLTLSCTFDIVFFKGTLYDREAYEEQSNKVKNYIPIFTIEFKDNVK